MRSHSSAGKVSASSHSLAFAGGQCLVDEALGRVLQQLLLLCQTEVHDFLRQRWTGAPRNSII